MRSVFAPVFVRSESGSFIHLLSPFSLREQRACVPLFFEGMYCLLNSSDEAILTCLSLSVNRDRFFYILVYIFFTNLPSV